MASTSKEAEAGIARETYIDRWFKNCFDRLPVRHRMKVLQDLQGYDDKIEQAKSTLRQGDGVFITGKPGTGKTHMAVGLMKFWFNGLMPIAVESHYRAWPLFVPAPELMFQLKSTFDRKSGPSETDITQKYSGASLLVLDDLGAERESEWARQVLYLILNRRYNEALPTIITSNLSLAEIAEQIDDRLASRIMEMGIAIELVGKDRRVEKELPH